MRNILKLKKISKSINNEVIIDKLDLEVGDGEFLAILGPSGCGKSSTLRIIAGLLQQDKGQVWLDRKRIDETPINKRNIGFVFQNYSLFPHMSVKENIGFGLKIRGVPSETRNKKINEMLHLIGLEGMDDRFPAQLSGGQQQRVALARALAIDPKLLLLDEPFGALDSKTRKRIRRDLKRILHNLSITGIFVTHDQEEAFMIGDRVAVMHKGKIGQIDRPRKLYENPKTTFVAEFIGNLNVLKIPGMKLESDQKVMVRPEDIFVDKFSNRKKFKGIKGILLNYVFYGPFIELTVGLENKETLIVVMPKAEFVAKNLHRRDELSIQISKYRDFSD